MAGMDWVALGFANATRLSCRLSLTASQSLPAVWRLRSNDSFWPNAARPAGGHCAAGVVFVFIRCVRPYGFAGF